MAERQLIAPLAIPCPTCDAAVGVSCPQFDDPDTNHMMRALAAPKIKEAPVSLYLDVRVGTDRIGDFKVTRVDVHNGNDPDGVNTYRWHYSDGDGRESTGLIHHRFGDGALALAQKALGEIIDRQSITAETLRKLSAGMAPNV